MTLRQLYSVLFILSLAFGADTVDSELPQPQFSFSYWNDNFALQHQLSSVIPPGDDDYLTASFRLEMANGHWERWHGLELYYAIFTNRAENHRFDMLAGRWFREMERNEWRYKLGLGGLVRGNLGGGEIQNNYHRVRGYSDVDLPYLDEWRFGVLFYGRISYELLKVGQSGLHAYSTSALRLGAGPTNLRIGLEGEHSAAIPGLPVSVTLIARVGYAHYLSPREVIEAHFSQGMVLGVFAGFVFREQFALSTWITENQYGLHDPHYGLTLSYRIRDLILPRLDSVIFP